MTRASWAERKVEQATTGYSWNARIRKSTVILPSIAAKLIRAEHQRAVRIVERMQKGYASKNFNLMHSEKIAVCELILAALQRGRTRKGV